MRRHLALASASRSAPGERVDDDTDDEDDEEDDEEEEEDDEAEDNDEDGEESRCIMRTHTPPRSGGAHDRTPQPCTSTHEHTRAHTSTQGIHEHTHLDGFGIRDFPGPETRLLRTIAQVRCMRRVGAQYRKNVSQRKERGGQEEGMGTVGWWGRGWTAAGLRADEHTPTAALCNHTAHTHTL